MSKIIEETLSSQLFFSILDSLSDGIYITDKKGLTLWLNKSSENLCGAPRSKLIGINVKTLEEQGVFYPSITMMAFESGETVSAVQTLRSGRKILVTGHVIPDSEGNTEFVIAHSRDISETIKTTAQLEETQFLLKRYIEEYQIINRQQNQKLSNHIFVGESREFNNLLELLKKVAVVDSTIIITGETGVGKSLIAEYIHKLSHRSKKPFIQVNCSAIPESLIESELFGYKKGAFTGANTTGKIGLVKTAEGGTLFLDEIGDLPFHLQSKLLLLLQNNTYMPIGDTKNYVANVRIIAATNSNLIESINLGKFRRDLYYRLSVLPIHVPALRDRSEDIFPLLHYYLKKCNRKYYTTKSISNDVLDLLKNYTWPGNIRELENLVERMVIISKADIIQVHDLPEEIRNTNKFENLFSFESAFSLNEKIKQIETELILKAYRLHGTTRKAADALGITQSSLMRRVKKYGIQLPK